VAIGGGGEGVCEARRQRVVTPESCRQARKSLTGRYPKTKVDTALADICLAAWSIPELEMGKSTARYWNHGAQTESQGSCGRPLLLLGPGLRG